MNLNKIDQHLGEIEVLLKALIFIAENTEREQNELLQHATVTLSWCVIDKLRAALKNINPNQS